MPGNRLALMITLLHATGMIGHFHADPRCALERGFALLFDARAADGVVVTVSEIPQNVRCRVSRRIGPASELHDPRAGKTLGMLLNFCHGRRGDVFRQDMAGQFLRHGDVLRQGVPGGREDLAQGDGEPFRPRCVVAGQRG